MGVLRGQLASAFDAAIASGTLSSAISEVVLRGRLSSAFDAAFASGALTGAISAVSADAKLRDRLASAFDSALASGELSKLIPEVSAERRLLKDHGPVTFAEMCCKLNLGEGNQSAAELVWKSLEV